MEPIQDVQIWPREGISDLSQGAIRLALPSMVALRQRWSVTRQAIDGSTAVTEFSAQLEREWAIETGQIENLYDIERGVTQTLIEEGFRASLLERGSTNKPPEFVLSLIEDQRDALEGLFAFVKQDRPLSTSYVKELHAAFDPQGNRMEVPLRRGEWKVASNYPLREGKRYLYCPPEQTDSEMDRLVAIHLKHRDENVSPEAQAAWLHHRFTQIHPFQDGNGRVARALASLVLIQAGMFPMIVPREEKDVYLDALEAADAENLRPFLLLIARRQQTELEKAVRHLARAEPKSKSIEEAAATLARAISLGPASRTARLASAVDKLSDDIGKHIAAPLTHAFATLRTVKPDAGFDVSRYDDASALEEMGRVLEDALRLDGPAGSPLRLHRVDLRLAIDATLWILVHGSTPDLDENIEAVALINDTVDIHRLDIPKLSVRADFVDDLLRAEQPRQWLSGVIIATLDALRDVA